MRSTVYNPHGKPESDLPIIYGFNNGGPREFLSAILVAEDGTFLGGHCCSHEYYMPGDLGILEGSRPDRHETFREHYPDGYRMEFVGFNDVKAHPKLWSILNTANKRSTDGNPSPNKGGYPSVDITLTE